MKDLTKEKHFSNSELTSLEEIKKLAIEMLNTTWGIFNYVNYPYGSKKEINLLDLGWSFEFSNKKNATGSCYYRKRSIRISKWLLEQNLDKAAEFENTLRHEIAHAIDFEIRGKSSHDEVWKFIARQVLCTAERCYDTKVIQTKVVTKYTLRCTEEGCNYERKSHKARPKNARSYPCCTDCFNSGKGYKRLEQVQNY